MLYVSVALQTMLMGIIFTSLMFNFNAAQETKNLISRAWEPSTKKDISFLVLMRRICRITSSGLLYNDWLLSFQSRHLHQFFQAMM